MQSGTIDTHPSRTLTQRYVGFRQGIGRGLESGGNWMQDASRKAAILDLAGMAGFELYVLGYDTVSGSTCSNCAPVSIGILVVGGIGLGICGGVYGLGSGLKSLGGYMQRDENGMRPDAGRSSIDYYRDIQGFWKISKRS